MKYETKETFVAKENLSIFGISARIKDLQSQNLQYITSKLGNNYVYKQIYPAKRKKFPCPTACGNTYIWINGVYTSEDIQAQILEATCAQLGCGEYFLIYQEIAQE